MKENVGKLGGIIAFLAIMAFAIQIACTSLVQNSVSWILWLALDIVSLLTAYYAGNKKPWLQIAFSIGAFTVVGVLLVKGTWSWGFVEIISVIGVMISLLVWWKIGPTAGVIASTIATDIAGLPAMHDAIILPSDPASAWMWGMIAISAICLLISTEKWTVKDRLYPASTLIYNTLMFAFTIL